MQLEVERTRSFQEGPSAIGAKQVIREAIPFHLKGVRLAKNQEPKAKSQ